MDRDQFGHETVLDIPSALRRLGGDVELLTDLIGFFIEDAPQLLDKLQAAIKQQDANAARKAAHALKGLILGCGGVRAARVAQVVEDAAQTEDWDKIVQFAETLGSELDTLIDETLSYRHGRSASSASRSAHTEFEQRASRQLPLT
jgi:HPt (histidine-containing phosphotransfer) domain-containing protein